MRAFFECLLGIAFPPLRLHFERQRTWRIVFRAGMHLLNRPDWEIGDYAARKIFSAKMKELA